MNKIKKVSRKIKNLINAVSFAILTGCTFSHATDANTAWNTTMNAVIPWVQKIGVVLVVFGGIEFAIANSTEDANQKIRATRFIVSGAIVLAVATTLGPLLLS